MGECKALNEKWGKPVDYMTNCNYPAECGGGVKREAYSECMKPCTRTSTSTNNAQINNQNSSNKIAVFLSYGGYTVYCPSQNASAVQSINSTMESKKNQWATDYNKCTDQFRDTNSCWTSCKAVHSSGYSQCSSTYTYTSSEYKTCTDTVGDNYSSCIGGCPSPSQSCDWVYIEQKSLFSQIEILCK